MKTILFCFLFIANLLYAQNDINWDGKYQIQLSDFQSTSSQIGDVKTYSIFTSCGPELLFYMSNAELMFTKNFNSKVSCTFKRSSSAIVSPDNETALALVAFAQYQFDLSELYARKLRKRIFEEKKAFSSMGFFKPIYDSMLKEFSEESTKAGKETDLGRKKDILKIIHDDVLQQIEGLSEFCKECKPKKRKK